MKTFFKAMSVVAAAVVGLAAPYGAVAIYLMGIIWYNQIFH